MGPNVSDPLKSAPQQARRHDEDPGDLRHRFGETNIGHVDEAAGVAGSIKTCWRWSTK
jgi:hypothetical protein